MPGLAFLRRKRKPSFLIQDDHLWYHRPSGKVRSGWELAKKCQGGVRCSIITGWPGCVWKLWSCWAQQPSALGCSPQPPCPNGHNAALGVEPKVCKEEQEDEKERDTAGESRCQVQAIATQRCSSERASPAVSGETDFLCWWGRVPPDSPRWGRKGKPSLQGTGGGWQQTGLLHTQVRDFTAILLTSSVFHCLSSLHRLKGREPYVPNRPQSKQSHFKATAFLPLFFFHTC